MSNHKPPHNTEAEQSILSSMLNDQESTEYACENLKTDDFYIPSNQLIFSAIQELINENKPVDIVTVQEKLGQKDLLKKVGGIEFLTQLASDFLTSANIAEYVKIVKDKSILRKLIKIGSDLATVSLEGKEPTENILEDAERKIFNISQKQNISECVPLKNVIVKVVSKIEEIVESGKKITGIPTGFIDLDNKTAGLQNSDLILLAARPSMGKTAFALNIAEYLGITKNIPVVIFSLEMSKEQLATRLLSSQAMIDAQNLRTGRLSDDDFGKIAEVLATLSDASIFIDDTPAITIPQLRNKCRKLKLEQDIKLVIIDYLQLMSSNKKSESRQQEISVISRGLKALAKELDIPILALSQLSRACEARADHRPMLSDLRESGAIEQDADLVMFLYRDEYYNPETDKKNRAELIISKQRNGSTGSIDLIWNPYYTKFFDLDNFTG